MIIWVECIDCDEFWCNVHRKHVHDCTCPDIENLLNINIDPYLDDETKLIIK